ncbi:MAG: NAD(+) synthase [Frankiaceae bacterium]
MTTVQEHRVHPIPFSRDVLALNAEAETDRIVAHLRSSVAALGHKGAVVGVSGGVDSSVALALSVRAFGPTRVVPLLLQEKESSPENVTLVNELCRRLGVQLIAEDITAALAGFGCYRRRDEAIRTVFPEYDATYKSRITLPSDLLEKDVLGLFSLTVISPEGRQQTKRLPLHAYLAVVAATNFKQRTRMAMLYHHAECRNYAVIGTANKNERDQGFFVKYGDGGADVDAIVHLYKTQIYQVAAHLGVPEEIQRRPPTTDTYSAPTTEEEFFFQLPFATMDLLWYAEEHDVPAEQAAETMQLRAEQVRRAYRTFRRRRRSTAHLRAPNQALQRCQQSQEGEKSNV